MAADTLARHVIDRWDKADKALLEERRDYWMNRAFYDGQQWTRWDAQSRAVASIAGGPQYENDRVRVTMNLVQERWDALTGRMAQRNLGFEEQPSAPDDATVAKARRAADIIESRRSELDWESVREEEIFSMIAGGTAAVGLEWDAKKGEQASPLWEDSGSQQITGAGEVSLTAFSIAEFTLEPGVRHWRDARWWITNVAMPPGQVKADLGLDFTPVADVTDSQSPLRGRLVSALHWSPEPERTAVYTLYERPNEACPTGRHTVVVNEKTVIDEEWPFPFKGLNLYPFRCLKMDRTWTGRTMVTAARPPQMLYNIIRSAMTEHVKLCGNARLWIPEGALDNVDELTDEPGEFVEYHAEPNIEKPGYMNPPDLPRWMPNECDRLEAELDGIMHTHEVARGVAPGDRNSGLALSILAEKNDTGLGPMARDQATGWGLLASMALHCYSAKTVGKRVAVTISDHGVPNKQEWDRNTIGDQWRVIVPLDAVMPTSKMAMQSMLTTMAQTFPSLATLPAGILLKTMEMPGSKALTAIADSDVAWAQFENDQMANGQVMVPEPWQDHAKHIAEHNAFRNSTEFYSLPDDIKAYIGTHIDCHEVLVKEELVKQAGLNDAVPGLAGTPQANEPLGSAVPAPHAEQMANVSPINPQAA